MILALSSPVFAQLWSSVIDPSRAVDWANPGVVGGIPITYTQCLNTQCNTVISAGSAATGNQISAALQNAPANTFVLLTAGTYTVGTATDGAIDFGGGKQNVILRGLGADQTFIIAVDDASCNGAFSAICLHSNDTNWKGGPSNGPVNLTGTFSKGQTTLTFASVPNLKVGFAVEIDQLDDSTAPCDDGSIIISAASTTCASATSPGIVGPFSLEGNGGGDQRSGRQQQQIVVVTQCGAVTTPGASCSGTNVSVTFTPGLAMANWSSGKTPQAWWATSPAMYNGVENLSIDGSGAGSGTANIEMFNCLNCWVKGVRGIDSGRAQVQIQYSARFTIRDSYFFLTQNSVSQSYGFECYGGADGLVENNILQAIAAPEMINGNCSGTVVGYNFSINNFYTNSQNYNASANNQHTAGVDNILFEGNYFNSVYGDVFHGTHHFLTYFRNRATGPQPKCWVSGPYASAVYGTCSSNTTPIVLNSFSRFENFIGNILGTTGVNTSYPGDIFDLGSGNSNGTVTVPSDPNVSPTLMRWGNCDSASGFGSCRFVSGEVPSALSGTQAPYSNPVPGSTTLPASFYYAAKPSWWPLTKAWPPIGPDVTGGNVSGVSGLAYTIPAQDCYLNTMSGPSDGTGAVLSFNANSCYVVVAQSPSANLQGQVSFKGAVALK